MVPGFTLIEDGKTCRHGNDRPKGRRLLHSQYGTQGHVGMQCGQREAEGVRRMWTRALILVSLERAGEARPPALGLATWNNFRGLWDLRGFLVVWDLALR